jgi:PAS domain S-box-containing protein
MVAEQAGGHNAGWCRVTADRRVVEAVSGFAALCGIPRELLPGTAVDSHFAPEDREAISGAAAHGTPAGCTAALAAAGSPVVYVRAQPCTDSGEMLLEVELLPQPCEEISDPAGLVAGLQTAGEFAYQAALDESGLRVEWVSGGCLQITGCTPAQLAESGGWLELLHPRDAAVHHLLADALRRYRRVRWEYRLLRPGGAERWVREDSCSVPVSGCPPAWNVYGALRETTAQRAAAREAHLLAEQRTMELRAANSALAAELARTLAGETSRSTLVERLRAVAAAVPALLGCPDEDTLCRRAVELARERLGIERCSIHLLVHEGSNVARGTYGVSRTGQVVAEHHSRHELPRGWVDQFVQEGGPMAAWRVDYRPWTDEAGQVVGGMGEVVTTPLLSGRRLLGVMYNDNALTRSPVDISRQEALAVYCALLAHTLEQLRLETRANRLAGGLAQVAAAADDLAISVDEETLLRRAVELARERLGLERTAIYLYDPLTGRAMGTYGTDLAGQTTDQRGVSFPFRERPGSAEDHPPIPERWVLFRTRRNFYREGVRYDAGEGWVVCTAIRGAEGPLGFFFNDGAITEALPDTVRQECLAVYASLVGSLLQRMRSEMARARSEAYFREVLENGLDVVALLDGAGLIRYLSPSTARVLGPSAMQSVGDDVVAHVHPEDAERTRELIRMVQEKSGGEARAELRFLHDSGEWRTLEVALRNLLTVPEVRGILVNARDTTERRRAEELLASQGRVLHHLATGTAPAEVLREVVGSLVSAMPPVGVAVFLAASDNWLELAAAAGRAAGEPDLGGGLRIGPRQPPLGAAVFTGQPVYLADVEQEASGARLRAAARRYGVGSVWAHPVHSSAGEVYGVIEICHPERRMPSAEEVQLLKSAAHLCGIALERGRAEERLRLIESAVDQSSDAVLIGEAPGPGEQLRPVYVNPAFTRMTGYTLEAIRRQGLRAVLPGNGEGLLDALASSLRRERLFSAEGRCRTRDGSEYQALWNADVVRGAHGGVTHWVTTHRDITERRAFAEQLLNAQKMEAVGRLAGGVAHDFNNLLAVISGYGELLEQRLPGGSGCERAVAEIRRAAARATDLTRQLLAFSRRQVTVTPVADVGATLHSLEEMLRRVVGERVALAVRCEEDLGGVPLDTAALEQVALNLVLNARDAMPHGGTVLVEVARCPPSAVPRALPPGEYIVLQVKDDGTGMDAQTRERIFEPFFTTKPAGLGTGLGLATVYAAVTQVGGVIKVDSAPGAGSEFRIYLPRVSVSAESTGAPPPSPPRRQPAGETILVAEDDELLREMVRSVLTSAGYRVLPAGSGEEALALAGTHEGPIHLLITDLVMPRIGGRELAARLAAARPETRAAFISGYPQEEVSGGDTPFLRKPFAAREFLGWVHAALHRPEPAGR